MDARTELNAEIKKSRAWLLGVGILMFVVDMVTVHLVYGNQLLSDFKTKISMISAAILVVFALLAYFTAKKPKLCLILGLCVFWGIHIFNAVLDPSTLAQGLLVKIFFTYALVQGLKSASRAETLMHDLGEVFD